MLQLQGHSPLGVINFWNATFGFDRATSDIGANGQMFVTTSSGKIGAEPLDLVSSTEVTTKIITKHYTQDALERSTQNQTSQNLGHH